MILFRLLLLISVITGLCLAKQSFAHEIELNGGWEFSQVGENKWYPATVPGVVHTDLLEQKQIADPYWENNEQKLQWIENKDWHYRTRFKISSSELKKQHVELVFEGLDTYAEVRLNDSLVLNADNMFRQWRIDIKRYLKDGENTLDIIFKSPISVNLPRYNQFPYTLPSGCETVETKVYPYTRKAAYHFGWDWGPRFVTAGIWRPVRIETWGTARITNATCVTESISKKKAKLTAYITIETDIKEAKHFRLFIDGQQTDVVLEPGLNTIYHRFKVKRPKLWWTNGLGKPNLYELDIKLSTEGGFQTIDKYNIKYGIRTVKLINQEDKFGTSFYFELNGKPVFMKGANYIPQDMFLPRVTNDKYRRLIGDVKAANMNMLRVWGGGIYENDIFYDLCDANGILVWQDFMFAGSLYPGDHAFFKTVKEEVTDNILRLRHHPCIALWCGNNEIEVAWKNWGWQKQYNIHGKDSVAVWNNYRTLFHSLIPQLVKKYDKGRAYTSTSPLSNWGTPENFNHGSMHYWGVWHGKEKFEKFEDNVGRFMVEFGFQSFPEMNTIKSFAADSSLSLESDVMLNRQKSYIGNGVILEHINQYYPTPKSFEEFVRHSQMVQAKAMKMAIQAYMDREPHCMGALFWQLNDCWPGPSWSVIDYYGNHKMAYDTIQKVFSNKW